MIILIGIISAVLWSVKKEPSKNTNTICGDSKENDKFIDNTTQSDEASTFSLNNESSTIPQNGESSTEASSPEIVSSIDSDSSASKEELSQEELDYIHCKEREKAAKPYEDQILPEFLSDYERNDRVIGHIYIEGTDIDCPVLSKLEDYEYYLTHDIDNNESKQGCIILDPDSEIGIGTKENGYLLGYEPSTNQLVHGHNMRAGTMFGTLEKYADEEYGLKHKYIYFDSLYEKRTYELVTVFYSEIYPEESDSFKYYLFNQAKSQSDWDYWYENIMNLGIYTTDIPVEYGDEMITLSTCAYYKENGRFAVIGKRIK